MVLTLLLFCPLISALVFPGPVPTAVENAAKIQPWTPRPTEGPDLKELLKRQDLSYTIIEGPDDICGYQFGSSDYPLGLCDTSKCGFATAVDQSGYIYCFSSTTTEYRPTWTSCMVGAEATSCLANAACSGNPNIIQCTDSTAAYCNLGTFIGLGVEAVWCDSTNYAGIIPVSTTYVGQINRALTTVAGSSTSISTKSSSSSSSSTPTPPPSTTPSPIPIPIPTPTPTPTPKPTPKPTPVGAIVGGVVGGLAAIAAIIAVIFLCLRSNRQYGQNPPRKEIAESPTQPQNPSSPAPNAQAEKYPAPAGYVSPVASPSPEQQPYQHAQPQTQYPPEKYPTAAGRAFKPAQYATTSSANPEQQQYQQYQAPPAQQQPQRYQAPVTNNQAIPMQASQPVYQPPQQQVPAASRLTEQQPTPATQNTYYSAPQGAANFQVQQPIASEIHRESTVSTISAPSSPAPPYAKMKVIHDVHEMPGEYHGRNEMSGESHHVASHPKGRNEMSGESAPHPFTSY